MNVLIDTNILISAALNHKGTPYQAFTKAVSYPNHGYVNDRPILRAAIYANADILLTGDKDFLESGLQYPKIVTASDFVQMM